MLALRWKDRKDVFFLSTIHAPPEVPNWVDTGEAPDSDPDVPEEEDPAIVRRSVRVRGQWRSQKIYRPPIVADYNHYMGGVDLCDQMTAENKSKKQQRWYMRVFIKFLQLAIYIAYILEGYEIPHNDRGKRKRDLLKFNQDLCVQLVGTTPTRNKTAKRQRQNMPPEDRLENVGSHLPLKGEGNNHRCVVCEKKYTEAKKTGEPSKGTRPATNVVSVMFTCALAFLVKVALWTITLKLITGNELGGYSFHLFFFLEQGLWLVFELKLIF